ncbi:MULTISPECIES: cation-translocating P-type ATPase [Flavobacteriaceae]|uniref:Cation-translocating P-type ATPase n=1 Tax=Lutibacter litoralis TaxID=321268 RepID=A0ABV5JZQ8_9FLAO|nr:MULTISPECIES: cation-transporting P-type ATPase [Flavobacteriaceae]GGK48150.1 ATPase [Lutibacter litoralis]
MTFSSQKIIQKPHTLTPAEVVKQLDSDSTLGLTTKQAKVRIEIFGKNKLPEEKSKNMLTILFEQLLNPIIYILLIAVFLALIFRDWLEGIAILIVIIITVAIGFFMELQALRSLEALQKMGQSITKVLRGGILLHLKSSLLVPGDLVILEAGDMVTADARLIYSENLTVKEAVLTGESFPIEKEIAVLPINTSISELNNMVFRGTLVTKGMAKAIVIATGKHTELGKIQQLGITSKKTQTPLEKKLTNLSKHLILLTLFLTILIIITGYYRGNDFMLILQTGIALAVASIPEGLPIVATIALAQGMLRLSKKQVIIKKLEAVQTLGATTIICTDKTGTLTEDKMKVHTLAFETNSFENVYHKKAHFSIETKKLKEFEEMVLTSILCNDALLSNHHKHGDAIDLALNDFAEFVGFNPHLIQKKYPEKMEIAFDTERKMMATVNQFNSTFKIYAKGAFESIAECCDTILSKGEIIPFNNKEEWIKKVDNLASQGLRVLAFAFKDVEKIPACENFLHQLTFIGIIGFIDPPREDVKATITTYKNAGIRVIMMTGDHPGTAKKVAQEIGLLPQHIAKEMVVLGKDLTAFEILSEEKKATLLNTIIFARVTPKQKLDIISLFQQNNAIVGMIGDGVNDVPALKKADIGIAMGIRGTEAARATADVILKDDKFTSIELSIHQGRAIFENIRQFVVYLLSSNLAEIISVGIAALLNLPSPLLPLQILFLNLVTDIFPSLALGLGKGEKDLMKKPPRLPNEPIMTAKLWNATIIYGLCITVSVLGITLYSNYMLKLPSNEINNMAFFTLIFAQLLNVFNLPKRQESFFNNEVTSNKWIWIAIVICIVITSIAYFTPLVAIALSISPLTISKLITIILFGFGSLLLAQFIKRIGWTI